MALMNRIGDFVVDTIFNDIPKNQLEAVDQIQELLERIIFPERP